MNIKLYLSVPRYIGILNSPQKIVLITKENGPIYGKVVRSEGSLLSESLDLRDEKEVGEVMSFYFNLKRKKEENS